MPSPYDVYQNKRSYLIDTAETPEDKKSLKADLAKLKAQYDAQKAKAAAKAPTGAAAVEALKKQVSPSGVAAAEAAARKAIEKQYPGLYIPTTRIAKSPDAARAANAKKLNK